MDYDAAADTHDSYYEAIEELRKRKELKQFRCEQIGDAVLYLGDCLQAMPLLPPVDAVVTDPPYGIGFRQRTTGATIIGDDCDLDPSPWYGIGKQVLFWGANHSICHLGNQGQWLVWIKRAIEIAAPKSYSDCEMAWTNIPGPIKAIRHISDGCIRQGAEHGIVRVHPFQKPIAVMEWCLGFVTGNTILDPFMGSGTTGVACAKLGRKFIGIEIDETYFNIACERIREAYAQPDLFIEPPKKPTQESMF